MHVVHGIWSARARLAGMKRHLMRRLVFRIEHIAISRDRIGDHDHGSLGSARRRRVQFKSDLTTDPALGVAVDHGLVLGVNTISIGESRVAGNDHLPAHGYSLDRFPFADSVMTHSGHGAGTMHHHHVMGWRRRRWRRSLTLRRRECT